MRPAHSWKSFAHGVDLGRGKGGASAPTWHSTCLGPCTPPSRAICSGHQGLDNLLFVGPLGHRQGDMQLRKARQDGSGGNTGDGEKPSCVLNSVNSYKFIESPFAEDLGETKSGNVGSCPSGTWGPVTGTDPPTLHPDKPAAASTPLPWAAPSRVTPPPSPPGAADHRTLPLCVSSSPEACEFPQDKDRSSLYGHLPRCWTPRWVMNK